MGAQEGTESLRKKLSESEQENGKLKKTLAKRDEELLILGKHSFVMQRKASMARDRAEARLAKLSKELKCL